MVSVQEAADKAVLYLAPSCSVCHVIRSVGQQRAGGEAVSYRTKDSQQEGPTQWWGHLTAFSPTVSAQKALTS